jgi:hypothetical protein
MASKSLKVTTIEQGQHSGIKSRWMTALKRKADWQELWNKHTSNQHPQPPLPKIDFKKEMVIAVFPGGHTSGGYSVHITNVEATRTGIEVTYKHMGSGGIGGGVTTALSEPFHIVRVKTSKKSVNFIADE